MLRYKHLWLQFWDGGWSVMAVHRGTLQEAATFMIANTNFLVSRPAEVSLINSGRLISCILPRVRLSFWLSARHQELRLVLQWIVLLLRGKRGFSCFGNTPNVYRLAVNHRLSHAMDDSLGLGQ